MTNVIDKLVRNGQDYIIQGSGSGGGGGADYSNLLFFGGGGLGDCVIRENTQLKAGTYEFRNLTICEGVKLSFCGEGVPILKATGKIDNQGIIDLRNECGVPACCRCIAFLGVIQNHQHRFTLGPFQCKGGANGGCRGGGGWGQPGCGYTRCGICIPGGCPYGCNGGGGSGHLAGDEIYYEYARNAATGKNATAEKGGEGGRGGSDDGCKCAGGGSGGFGYRCGGDGGSSANNGKGGDGGNSLYGTAGKGGFGEDWNAGGYAGCGGCSYYGDGGAGGCAQQNDYARQGGLGGWSIWGNGGKGGDATGTSQCYDYRGGAGGDGGCSLYGNGGDGGEPTRGYYYNCCTGQGTGYGREGIGGSVGGGQYGLMLVAPTICNHCIIGCGGNGGNNSSHRCNYYNTAYQGGHGGHGADVSIFYCKCLVRGTICNRPGCGGYGHLCRGEDGQGGCLTICNLLI